MDGFSYSNIFETKGIEYLAIIAFFAILIPFWIILNRQVKSKKRVQKIIGTLSSSALQIPQGLYFTRNHTWLQLERSGNAKIGIDDLITHVTGDIKIIRKAKTDDLIRKGDLLAEIDHDGKQLQVYSPISGRVRGTNPLLNDEPGIVNEDPLMKGWIYRIRPSDWIRETQGCYVAGEATFWMEKELVRLKDFLVNAIGKGSSEMPGIILQDGGELRDNTLAELPGELWEDFQKNFLNSTD